MKSQYTEILTLEDMLYRFVFIVNYSRVLDTQTGDIVSLSEFNNQYAASVKGRENQRTGRIVSVQVTKLWRCDPKRKTLLNRTV